MSLRSSTIDSVVLDIEGTTSATGFVVDVLYPYSRSRFGALLSERSGDPEVARAVGAGAGAASPSRTPTPYASRRPSNAWLDEDRKATPLKTLQGIIWSEGFARGDLVSHFYDDVVPALRAWHAAGVRLHVYSSGSVAAQRAWFRSSPEGDLLPLVEGLYDTENAGPKQEPESYRTIAAALGTARPDRHPLPLRPAGRAGRGPRGRAGGPSASGGPGSRTTSRASATTRRRGRSTGSPSHQEHHMTAEITPARPGGGGRGPGRRVRPLRLLRLDARHLGQPVRGAVPRSAAARGHRERPRQG